MLLFGKRLITFIPYSGLFTSKAGLNLTIYHYTTIVEKAQHILTFQSGMSAICTSHLYGVLLVFSPANIEHVRNNFVTLHVRLNVFYMYNIHAFCLLQCDHYGQAAYILNPLAVLIPFSLFVFEKVYFSLCDLIF